MIKVNSIVKMNFPKIRQLTQAQVAALEQTAEALHTEVVQAQVVPFDTGNLQNESTFVDYSESSNGKVSLVETSIELPSTKTFNVTVTYTYRFGTRSIEVPIEVIPGTAPVEP